MSNQTDDASRSDKFCNAERLIEQARTYLAFGDQMRQFAAHLNQTASENTDWGLVIQQHFAQMKEAQSTGDPGIDSELVQLWMRAAEMWQQSVASLDIGKQIDQNPQNVAWQTYQQVQNEYLGLLQDAAQKGLDLMQQRLNAQSAPEEEQISSLRELYNLWVECNEETYGQMLRSMEYATLNGRLLNAFLTCYSQENTK